MNVWLSLIVALLAGFFGTAFYLWMRAELDERRWRKIIEAELANDRAFLDEHFPWRSDSE